MNIIKGDLIQLAQIGYFDVIIHGCNCFCTMRAGIAKTIRFEFPEAFDADKATKKSDQSKLGNYTYATITRNGRNFTVINAYTQFDYRGKGIKVDYDAIKSVFKKLKSQYAGSRFGFPMIGAGLAGGDWGLISDIIEEELKGEDFTLVKFSLT